MAYATIYIDDETTEERDSDRSTLIDPSRVQVEFEESDDTRECQHCRTRIELASVKDGEGKRAERWGHADGNVECDPQLVSMHDPDYDEDEDDPYLAEPISEGVSEFVNSASLNFDGMGMACTVTISVGDPRGCFTMTVRRLDDGKLILHVPHENEPMPHMPLRKLHEGTYEILSH